LVDLQLDAQNSYLFIYNTFIKIYFITQGNETLFPNWQKESWQTLEETSGYVRPERVNKWPKSMTDR
jgi:hypothetical protein